MTIQELEGLLINCTGLSDDEVEALGRRCWSDGYTDDGRVYVAHAHDGEDVYFFPDRFEHAFFTSSNPASAYSTETDRVFHAHADQPFHSMAIRSERSDALAFPS